MCGGALSLSYPYTYFVQRQGWVKIGATANLRRRINELARPAWTKHLLSPEGMDWNEPLVVLGVIQGNLEHEFHNAFHSEHVAGEWFLPQHVLKGWLDLEPLDLLSAHV